MSERCAAGASVTMADVIARSGASSGAVHAAFPDREACLLAALELGLQRAGKQVLGAYDVQPRWLDAIKAGLLALLAFVEDEPALARLLIVYSAGGGEQLLRRRAEVLDALAAAVDRGRQQGAADSHQPPAVIAEGVVGAVLAIIQARLLREPSPALIDLFGSLVSVIVLPYLGAGVARRELLRPAPRLRSAGWLGLERAGSVTDGVLRTRLTYRTVRVLSAIGEYPGASNREVADRAGVADQGQISKLLGRLQARGLIAKAGAGPTRGAPNAWRLTEHGEDVLAGVAEHAQLA